MRFSDYQQGDSGQGVTDLQSNLNRVGYGIGVDGSFGPETAAAVTHFQSARGVTGDAAGVAGPGTLIALSQAIAAGWGQSGFSYSAGGGDTGPSSHTEVPATPLPFGLTMGKIGLIALVGGIAWMTTRK